MCLKALTHQGTLIQHIKNPSNELIEIALKNNGCALKFIKNPTYDMFKIALKNNPYCLYDIENPSNELLQIAISQDGSLIEDVENQTEELCLLALENNINAIYYIKNHSDNICEYYLNNNGDFLNLKNPSYNICKLAIEIDPLNLKHVSIENQTEELYLNALNSNYLSIKYIKNLTPQILERFEQLLVI